MKHLQPMIPEFDQILIDFVEIYCKVFFLLYIGHIKTHHLFIHSFVFTTCLKYQLHHHTKV